MELQSGPASTDRNYWVFVALLCIGFAAYFVYDGARGWPEENRKKALAQLEQINAELPELGETPTQEIFHDLRSSGETDPASVRQVLGEPAFEEHAGGRIVERYVSLYGMATIVLRNGRVEWNESQWTLWNKTKAAIDAQFYWACIPGLIGLYGAFRAYQAATLRVTIDEEGMIYAGRRIAFADMVSLRDYSKKGWVDLYYKGAGGQETKRRLDNQKVDKFEEIIEIVCQVKGFENPLNVAEDDEAPSEHDAPADEGNSSAAVDDSAERD